MTYELVRYSYIDVCTLSDVSRSGSGDITFLVGFKGSGELTLLEHCDLTLEGDFTSLGPGDFTLLLGSGDVTLEGGGEVTPRLLCRLDFCFGTAPVGLTAGFSGV